MKKILIIILMSFISQNIYAQIVSGQDLSIFWKSYNKSPSSMTSEDLYNSKAFTYYCSGVIESVNVLPEISYYFDFPQTVTLGQLCAIIGRYVESHPEE